MNIEEQKNWVEWASENLNTLTTFREARYWWLLKKINDKDLRPIGVELGRILPIPYTEGDLKKQRLEFTNQSASKEYEDMLNQAKQYADNLLVEKAKLSQTIKNNKKHYIKLKIKEYVDFLIILILGIIIFCYVFHSIYFEWRPQYHLPNLFPILFVICLLGLFFRICNITNMDDFLSHFKSFQKFRELCFGFFASLFISLFVTPFIIFIGIAFLVGGDPECAGVPSRYC